MQRGRKETHVKTQRGDGGGGGRRGVGGGDNGREACWERRHLAEERGLTRCRCHMQCGDPQTLEQGLIPPGWGEGGRRVLSPQEDGGRGPDVWTPFCK